MSMQVKLDEYIIALFASKWVGINVMYQHLIVGLASIKRTDLLWPFIDHINLQKKRALCKESCKAKYSKLKA